VWFGHVAWPVAAGLIVGAFVAWLLSNAAGRFLFGLGPRDARAYAVAMITLLAAAFVATLLPARRAASVDPIEALRKELGRSGRHRDGRIRAEPATLRA
jgi:ABC-type antimicrobial peptide transport system permease subunit